MRFFILLALASFAFAAKSQNVLTGKVLDSLSREPIPYVNVYFASTTIGTVTDENGAFTIKNFVSGKYLLTFSFVGYNTIQTPVDFNNNEQRFDVTLSQQVIRLQEVSVKADSSNRDLYFQYFKQSFLGSSKNASQVEIMNPKNLRLFYDQDDSVFVAFAKHPIEVENRALGYRIFYQLLEFKIDFKSGKMDYRGIPRFELLDPKGPRELKKWESERRRAYNGSFSHLVRSLRESKLDENGFELHFLTRVPNKERPSDTYILQRLDRLHKKLLAATGTTINRQEITDSLTYYTMKYRLPAIIDNIGRKIIDPSELFGFSTNDMIRYKGIIQVTYRKESEEANYTIEKPPLKTQQSVINFLNQIKIYDNGYYENVTDVFFDGYMGWSEKLAELVPQEYFPGDDTN